MEIEREILQKNQNPPEHLVYTGRNTQSNKDMSTTLVVNQSNLLRDGSRKSLLVCFMA